MNDSNGLITVKEQLLPLKFDGTGKRTLPEVLDRTVELKGWIDGMKQFNMTVKLAALTVEDNLTFKFVPLTTSVPLMGNVNKTVPWTTLKETLVER